MSEIKPEIKEFRDIVDQVLANNAREIEKRPGRPVGGLDYRTFAKAAGLTFSIICPTDLRPVAYGPVNEKTWGVMTDEQRYEKYVGRLAIVSTESSLDSLERRWSFRAVPYNERATTSKIITETALIEDAVRWMRSPHLYIAGLERLMELSDEEEDTVAQQLAIIQTRKDKLQQEIDELETMHLVPFTDDDEFPGPILG